jgi:8-oxo-dGTP diphosphatase
MQHAHCSYCGVRYLQGVSWPRTCTSCGETTWSNPLPVAVVLLPVRYADARTGLVVVRRGIEPFRGEIALPGGFIETGESWREAAVRELTEETYLTAKAEEVRLFDVQSSANGGSLMIFGILPPRIAEELPESTPTEESMEWLVRTEPVTLAFPTHTEVMATFVRGPADQVASA